jgi:hypothetical protein
LNAKITSRLPTPKVRAAMFVRPSARPRTNARTSGMRPSASTENPNSLGSWLTNTVSAIPFM